MGMSLFSFNIDGCEILDLSRKNEFLKSRKGLGPIIFPHFNHFAFAPQETLALTEAFNHIKALKELGVRHPFQHGIGRYVPWQYTISNNPAKVQAIAIEIIFLYKNNPNKVKPKKLIKATT